MARTPYSEIRRYVNQRAQATLTARSRHESALKECRDYILPDVGQSFNRDPSTAAKDGARKDQNIINCTPTEAALTLAAGMQSGLTSPSRPWFMLSCPITGIRERPAAKAWLEQVQDIMIQVFAQSNVYNTLHDLYLHLGAFGTGVALEVEDDERVMHTYMLDQGSYALGSDKRGFVNALWRNFAMTAYQLAAEFGKENLPQSIQDKLGKVEVGGTSRDDDTEYVVECLIEPNSDALELPETAKRPYRSIYWLTASSDGVTDKTDKKGILAIRGYSGNPILAPRWHLPTGVWGFGPGRRAMGDIRQLQTMETDKLRALRKMIDPPLSVPDTMKGVALNTFPGGLNYYGQQGAASGRPAIGPLYQISPDLSQIDRSISVVEQRIRRAFFNDLFLMLANLGDTPRMTAREVIERHEEKLIMLGPVLERLHLELLDVLIDRTFQILVDKRMLPDPPQELAGMPLKVEYISMLAAAQRMAGMQTLSQFVGFVGGMAPVMPTILDKIDGDGIVDKAADALGVPSGVVLSDKVVYAIRQQRAKQQQAQQAVAMAAEAAKGAKNLGGARVAPDTALGAIAGQAGYNLSGTSQ